MSQEIYHTRPLGETGIKPEQVDLITWYEERLATFGEMTTEPANATDGQTWRADLEGTEVKEITGPFFRVRGTKVTRHSPQGESTGSWVQPGIHQTEYPFVLPTRNGDLEISVSGLVGAIRDEYGNVLLTLVQEPYAKAPKNVLFRTPFQTSATKFMDLLSGEREKDANLYDSWVRLGGGANIKEFFGSDRVDSFPLPFADANRIEATNYGFAVIVSDPALRDALKNKGVNRWCSPAEVREIMRAGLLNGITVSAIFASTSLIK